MRFLLAILLGMTLFPMRTVAGTHVDFRSDGIALVNNKPFFPLGIWVYSIDSNVMADLHEHRFNTVIGNGFTPKQMQFIADNGMMAVPCLTDDFLVSRQIQPRFVRLVPERRTGRASPNAGPITNRLSKRQNR